MEEANWGAGSRISSVMKSQAGLNRRSCIMMQFQWTTVAILQGTLELGWLFRAVLVEDKQWDICASMLTRDAGCLLRKGMRWKFYLVGSGGRSQSSWEQVFPSRQGTSEARHTFTYMLKIAWDPRGLFGLLT